MKDNMQLSEHIRPHAEEAARLLKALAHPERLMILCHLIDGEQSAGELWRRSTLSQSAFSQHLGVLREECLVSCRKEAQTVFYQFNHPAAGQLLAILKQHFCP